MGSLYSYRWSQVVISKVRFLLVQGGLVLLHTCYPSQMRSLTSLFLPNCSHFEWGTGDKYFHQLLCTTKWRPTATHPEINIIWTASLANYLSWHPDMITLKLSNIRAVQFYTKMIQGPWTTHLLARKNILRIAPQSGSCGMTPIHKCFNWLWATTCKDSE